MQNSFSVKQAGVYIILHSTGAFNEKPNFKNLHSEAMNWCLVAKLQFVYRVNGKMEIFGLSVALLRTTGGYTEESVGCDRHSIRSMEKTVLLDDEAYLVVLYLIEQHGRSASNTGAKLNAK